MSEITHVFHIASSKEAVFDQISSRDGLASWWTEDTEGNAALGGKLIFSFNGQPMCTMEVEKMDAPQNLVWKCVEGHPDWVGTRVHFELSDNEGKTRLRFAHTGWAQQDDFFAQCNFSWGRYLVSLRKLCETGKGEPWPAHVPA